MDAAELGTSELVTNALLHGRPPLSLRVRGTSSHPRIEVRDASTAPPTQPGAGEGDDILATVGRGLSMVAMSAVAWGATIEEHGKVVWFEPATEVGGDSLPNMVVDSAAPPDEIPLSAAALPVRLIDIDVRTALGLWHQYTDLRRELRLLSVAHQDQYPLAANLSAMFESYERAMPRKIVKAIRAAHARGVRRLTFEAPMEPESAPILTTMLEMFDLADAFCKAERLLAIQRTPDQRSLHVWWLSECVRQLGGAEPTPYPRPAPGMRSPSSQQVS